MTISQAHLLHYSGSDIESMAKKEKDKNNKSGIKNSLVSNINARKKKGISRSKKKSTVSKKSYKKMENDWNRK